MLSAGWEVFEVPWNARGQNWSEFQAVVIRSTWDYQNAPQKFLSTLQTIESSTSLFNSSAICEWNLAKSVYLPELEGQGIRTVPTHWSMDGLSEPLIARCFRQYQTEQLVVKPTISASAYDTFVLRTGDRESNLFACKTLASRPVMLQPFQYSVQEHGEYSLFYFGHRFSHAILKQPANGDFRVQEEYGGRIIAIDPPTEVVALANQVSACLPENLLYSRIDILPLNDGQPAVMEVELIEPSLYLEHSPSAPHQFVERFLELTKRC